MASFVPPCSAGGLGRSGLLQPSAADRCHPRLAQVRHAQARLAQVVGVALEVGPVAVIPQWISKMQVECRGRERLSIEPDSRRATGARTAGDHGLAVDQDDCAFDAERSANDGRRAVGPVMTVAREAADARAIPANHQPVAVASRGVPLSRSIQFRQSIAKICQSSANLRPINWG